MLLGFVKSIMIGSTLKKSKNTLIRFIQIEITAARLYGIGYAIGACTSLTTLNFVIAQVFWSMAYFRFKKDTKLF